MYVIPTGVWLTFTLMAVVMARQPGWIRSSVYVACTAIFGTGFVTLAVQLTGNGHNHGGPYTTDQLARAAVAGIIGLCSAGVLTPLMLVFVPHSRREPQ